MKKATAEAILRKADSVEIRGRKVHISLSRGSEDRPPAGGPDRELRARTHFKSKGDPWNKGNKPFRKGGKPGGFKKGGAKPFKKPFKKSRKG